MLGPPLTPLAGPASTLVEGWWTSTVRGPRDVIPDGAIDVMWTAGRVPWLAGADTVPHTVTLPVGTTVVGVRVRAGVAAVLLGSPATEATDRRVPFDALLARPQVDALVDATGTAVDAAAVARALATAVRRAVPLEWCPDPVVDAAIAAVRAGRRPVTSEVGPRQLRRRFTHAVGYGPAFYHRVCRLDRFTRALATGGSLARTAAEVGYYDQAHLTRDCVELLGCTPTLLREA